MTNNGVPVDLNDTWNVHVFMLTEDYFELYHEIATKYSPGVYTVFLGHVRDTGRYKLWVKLSQQNGSEWREDTQYVGEEYIPQGLVIFPPPLYSGISLAVRVPLSNLGITTFTYLSKFTAATHELYYTTYAGSHSHMWLIDPKSGIMRHGYGWADDTGVVATDLAGITPGAYHGFIQPAIDGLLIQPPVIRHRIVIDNY